MREGKENVWNSLYFNMMAMVHPNNIIYRDIEACVRNGVQKQITNVDHDNDDDDMAEKCTRYIFFLFLYLPWVDAISHIMIVLCVCAREKFHSIVVAISGGILTYKYFCFTSH